MRPALQIRQHISPHTNNTPVTTPGFNPGRALLLLLRKAVHEGEPTYPIE